MLPNGATDAKSVAVDKNQTYAYVTHLIARYQLPTNQLDRGWMATNTLSIIDLKAEEIADFRIVGYSSEGSRQSVVGDCHSG